MATLFDICHDFKEVRNTYLSVVKEEIEYRGNKHSVEECLLDSFDSALSILSLGKFLNEDYRNYVEGFKRISEHIVGVRLNPNNAYLPAAKIMLLSICILKDVDPFALEIKQKGLIGNPPYNKINRLVKIQPEAFNVAATAIEIMND